MLSRSVPSGFTFSPSEATPHLTINHDVAADLDSSNAFEGLYPSSCPLGVCHGPQTNIAAQAPRSSWRCGSLQAPTPSPLEPSRMG